MMGGTQKRERTPNSVTNTPPPKLQKIRGSPSSDVFHNASPIFYANGSDGVITPPRKRKGLERSSTLPRAVRMNRTNTDECRTRPNCSAQDSQPVASLFGPPDRSTSRDVVSTQGGIRWSAAQYAALVSGMGREHGALGAVLTSSILTPFFVLSNIEGIWDQIISFLVPAEDNSSASSSTFGGKSSRSIKKQKRRTGKSRRRHRRTPKSKTLRFK